MISTDKTKIKQLLTRGVENIYPKPEFLEKKLLKGERLTLYTGYDPTASTLHIGHGITMLKLREFQDLGHKVIMLIGDFTGMIGDPTDKTSARQQLTKEEVLENCKEYQKQASSILDFEGDNPVELKYNSEWLAKLNFADLLEISAHFTVPRLLERDMFQERLKAGKTVHLHEFLYPVMQAYDSVAMDVDGEIGGNDQTFNMLAGRELMASMGKREKFVLTGKLLTDTTGKKMGKSEGNMIALADTPEDMYGKVMAWPDEFILGGFELCTRVEVPSEKDIKSDPMRFKKQLAYEIVKAFLGEKEAEVGKENFEKVSQKNEKPEDIPEVRPKKYDLSSALIESGLCKGTSEVRRLIDGNGIKINDKPVTSHDQEVKSGDLIQKGKRFFVKIK